MLYIIFIYESIYNIWQRPEFSKGYLEKKADIAFYNLEYSLIPYYRHPNYTVNNYTDPGTIAPVSEFISLKILLF